MNNNEQKKKAKKMSKEQQAFRFLCVVIALVVVFISVVCISVNKKNNSLLKEQTSKTENTSREESTITPNTTVENTTADSSENQNTTAEVTEKATQAVAANGLPEPKIITIGEDWERTLINSNYRISKDYTPDLVYVCGSGERLDKKVAPHYEEMYQAAKADGVTLTPCSGYRSYETQERNYNNKVSFYESQGYSHTDAQVKAATIIMPPGSSEHNLGYAMDIVCVDEWFEDTEEFKWLTEHAAEYGFIMRYPKDKQDITKVIYEPWHWRYVGVELAQELKSGGLVMEEYFGEV
ncbi:MAG: D-alanyl-D-alanine carboxypeptidase family protein [Acutalibacteraceae bacterium]